MNPILLEIAWPEWLFGNPWPLAVGLVLLFAGLRLVGRRMEKPKLLRASWGALGAMLLVLAAAYLVETRSERLVRQTRELAQAGIGPDFKVLDSLLAPEIKVSTGNQSRGIAISDQVLRARLASMQAKTMVCSNMEATFTADDAAFVHVSVQAGSARWEGAVMTTWNVYWKKTPAGWRVTELKLVGAPLGMTGFINLWGK